METAPIIIESNPNDSRTYEVLGNGAFGMVAKLFSKSMNRWIARKCFARPDHFSYELHFYGLCKSVEHHPDSNKIVQLLRWHRYPQANKFFLDLELATSSYHRIAFGDDVDNNNNNNDGVGRTKCPELSAAGEVRRMVVEAIRGVCFLHEAVRILHNDLKPLNLLRFPDGSTKICDLGICSEIDKERSIGTVGYCAPEIYDDSTICMVEEEKAKSDVFGLGVTFFTIVEGRPPTNLSSKMLHAYRRWNDEVDGVRREEALQIFKKAAQEFYREDFRASVPAGLNVKKLGYAVAHLIADMCAVDPDNRPKSACCLLRLCQLEQIESPAPTTKSLAVQTSQVDAFAIGVGNVSDFFEHIEPQAQPQPQLRPSSPTQASHFCNVSEARIEQLNILEIAAVDIPAVSTACAAQVEVEVEAEAPVAAAAVVVVDELQRLTKIVDAVAASIASGKKAAAHLSQFVDESDLVMLRQLRKRGPNDSLMPLSERLLKLIFSDSKYYKIRKRLFCTLTNRSENYWKKSGPLRIQRKFGRENDAGVDVDNDVDTD
jgi:serine/threonine protein kinase